MELFRINDGDDFYTVLRYDNFRTENICVFLISEDDEKSQILILMEEFGVIPMNPVTERIEEPWLRFGGF